MKKSLPTLKQSKYGWKRHIRAVKKREALKRKISGFLLHQEMLRALNPKSRPARNRPYKYKRSKLPEQSENIIFLQGIEKVFSERKSNGLENGLFVVPKCFSLIENHEESFTFLRRLFDVLLAGKAKDITLDYANCERIDVDASMCMDLLLQEFIIYLRNCHGRGRLDVYPSTIRPINYDKDNIKKVLFSIGAFRNIKKITIKYDDIEALPVLINSRNNPDCWQRSEIDVTAIVDYIGTCLGRMNRELSQETIGQLYRVIGEVMSNAEEHSTIPHRYAIGFFQESDNGDDHFGIFNFSIFNFGNTIYQMFKSESCPNQKVISQMNDLSEDYTKKGLFFWRSFEEETLWTLYALQEGVTSTGERRGNGSIQYINSFFGLKGETQKDNISQLVVISGNTRITFDGTYQVVEKPSGDGKRAFKMMTFNNEGDIRQKPDKKFVTFAPYFFPGTLISARILIKFDNVNS